MNPGQADQLRAYGVFEMPVPGAEQPNNPNQFPGLRQPVAANQAGKFYSDMGFSANLYFLRVP